MVDGVLGMTSGKTAKGPIPARTPIQKDCGVAGLGKGETLTANPVPANRRSMCHIDHRFYDCDPLFRFTCPAEAKVDQPEVGSNVSFAPRSDETSEGAEEPEGGKGR